MTVSKQDTSKIEHEFIICPTCSGSGKQGLGFSCSKCNGIGTGIFYHGLFFYFGPSIGFAMIELNHLRKKINSILNFAAFGFGLFGFICLFVWIFQVSEHSVRLEEFAFWREKSWLLFIFWTSLIADFFVIYRITRELLSSVAIKVFKYNEISKEKNPLSKMNNWDDLKTANSDYVIDISKAISEDANNVIEEAYMLARKWQHKYLTPMHLFFTALTTKEAASVFSRLGVDYEKLIKQLKDHLSKKEYSDGITEVSLETKQLLIDAYLDASKWGQKKVNVKNFICSAPRYDKMLSEILYDLEIDQNKIENVIQWFIVNEKQVLSYRKFRSQAKFKPASAMDRAYTSVATPLLNSFSYDLTIAAKWNRLEYCVERDKDIETIWEVLESGSRGVLLLGPDGVGKKTLMAGIAQKMVEEDVPKFLLDKRLIELDIARLISGVSASDAEGRMMMIIDEITRAGNIVLFIKNIETILGISSGSEGSMGLSEVLNSAIDRKMFFVFASVTSENYLKYLEGTTLDLSLSKIDLLEPKGNQAIRIIESKVSALEYKYGVYFSYNAIEQSVLMSSKYMHEAYLPKKAVNILEMTAVRASKKNEKYPMVNAEDVAKIVSEITDIPVTKISENEGKELLNLEEKMHERMVSQHEAVTMVASSLRRARTDMREGVRPIANFLFLGPTGVGKTELAKTVADVYFGDEKYMIRIDMSEYQHADSIKKMIGDSDGTKGFLTEAVRKAPFSLVLLDEIEKAHPDILNIFLQVMDDGRLTDGQGHLVDFTNAILIATSNAGAAYIQDEIYKGTPIETISAELINNQLNKIMRPELINRFDGVIVFEPLSLGNVVDIARLMLKKIEKMLLTKGVELRISEEGLRILASLGFDPKFGARPLRRVLQDKIENQIANKILSGELKRRDTVVIDDTAKVEVEKGVLI